MIMVKITAGLGNQMFQYALGRRISYINNTPLILDINNYSISLATPRKYMLHIFNIKEKFTFFNKIPRKKPLRLLRRYTDNLINYYRKSILKLSYIKEKHFHFDPAILTLKDNVYLEGCWQSEKYFYDISDIIRKDFTFKKEPDNINRKMIEKISNTNSVCVHVRRGDYVSNPAVAEKHGICSNEYYNTCINFIKEKVSNPHFFIFSDDPEWAQINIKPDYQATYINHNGSDKDYEDMRLMIHCKHFIIANSSFSWWGAWLGEYSDKLVLAPEKWFNTKELDIKDIIPDRWIRV